MRYISCLVLVFLLGCRVDDENTIGPEHSANAYIFDSSKYADGCEIYLQLDSGTVPSTGTQYKFTSTSLPLIRRMLLESVVNPGNSFLFPVTIRYRETSNQSVLACGWYSPTVTEIKVLEIHRR